MIKKKVLYIASTLLLGTLFLVCINVFGGSSDQGADKRNTFMPIKVAYAETLEDINVNMDSLMSEIEQEMKTNPELAMLGSPISFIKQSQAYKNIIGLGLKSVKPLYDKLYESHDAGLYEYILALAIEEITQEEYVYNTEYGWKNSLEFRMCYETKVNNVVFNVEKIINDETLNDEQKIERFKEQGLFATSALVKEYNNEKAKVSKVIIEKALDGIISKYNISKTIGRSENGGVDSDFINENAALFDSLVDLNGKAYE